MFTLLENLQEYPPSAIFSTAAILFIIGTYILLLPNYQFPSKAPKKVNEGYPILGALRFFTARWDFFQHARAQTPSGSFSFLIGKHPVVGLSGEKSRQFFFDSKYLGFAEGYAVLFGKSPSNASLDTGLAAAQDFGSSFFSRRVTRMLKTENFSKSLPHLRGDITSCLDLLEKDATGITDPFESIYRVVYQLTMRMVGCDDIAENPELLEKTLQLYETVENSATPTSILFPWFPSLGLLKRTLAGGRLYMILNRIVCNRQKTGDKRDDPLQFLIDQGDSMEKIVEFVIGSLFAGLLNSGVNAAWVLVYLANDPYWLPKVRGEVFAAAEKYSNDPSLSLEEKLSLLPVEAWESEFPITDLCLRDSIRLQLLGTAFRRNISGKDIPTGSGDEVIPAGAFVTYHIADIHLNPSIYKDPTKWDPSRYLPDRAEDKKTPMSFLGWGAGRHPCLGIRFAKLEQNMIVAYFLARFDFSLTDKIGNPVSETPPINFNGWTAAKPGSRPYLKFTRRV